MRISPKLGSLSIANLLRSFVVAVFIFGVIGAITDLVLLEHTEDTWQLVPLILLGASLVVLVGYALVRRPIVLHTFRVLMALFVVGGCLGMYFHLQGNMEFELEMYPSLKGLDLFWESITGATPALAPGMMIQLGLLGLIFTFRHPVLAKDKATSNGELS